MYISSDWGIIQWWFLNKNYKLEKSSQKDLFRPERSLNFPIMIVIQFFKMLLETTMNFSVWMLIEVHGNRCSWGSCASSLDKSLPCTLRVKWPNVKWVKWLFTHKNWPSGIRIWVSIFHRWLEVTEGFPRRVCNIDLDMTQSLWKPCSIQHDLF